VSGRRAAPIAALAILLAQSAAAAGLDRTEQRIVAAVDARRDAAIELLEETVNVRSATENHAGVQSVGAIYARELAGLGFATRWLDQRADTGRAGHLIATRNGSRGGKVLLIGHLDTVHETEPFRREGDRAYGNGTADMKGGNLIIVEALRALAGAGVLEDRAITVVLTGDEEEPGIPVERARAPLVEAARDARYALAFEGSTPGVAVIGRRGVATWLLAVEATQGHSSRIFSDEFGAGAIYGAAQLLERFRTELREPNLTYNPSLIVGGTAVEHDPAGASGSANGKTNVIAREVRIDGDLRFLGDEQYERAAARMRAIVAEPLPGVRASITIERSYPSMAPSDASRAVLAVLDGVSRDLGLGPVAAQDPASRGAGDISFVCNGPQLGCLDGLGADGDLAHAPGEWADLATLPAQTRRAALLIHRLAR
jgi:glutamate carboxypeptidase